MPFLFLLLGIGAVSLIVANNKKSSTPTPAPSPTPKPTPVRTTPSGSAPSGGSTTDPIKIAEEKAKALGIQLGRTLATDALGNIFDPATGAILVDAAGNPTSALDALGKSLGEAAYKGVNDLLNSFTGSGASVGGPARRLVRTNMGWRWQVFTSMGWRFLS